MNKKQQQAAAGHKDPLAEANRIIAAQREILQAQHKALMVCGDAIHEIRRAIGAYTDVKTDGLPRTLHPATNPNPEKKS